MAALPISSPNPGLVTLPTPIPPSITILFTGSKIDTVEQTSAPLVTSGSSPPSLMTAAVTDLSFSCFIQAISIVICLSFGRETFTFNSLSLFTRAESAALVAAAAHVPVVYPVLRDFFLPTGRSLSLISSVLWNIHSHSLNNYFTSVNNKSISSREGKIFTCY